MYKDVMILGAGHSLMAPQIPQGISPTKFNEDFYKVSKVEDNINSYGLYSDQKKFKEYYSDLELKVTSSEEFIEPTFRLLSACIVAKKYNPTDFSKEGVLRNSLNLLKGQTVYTDHEDHIKNAIGSVAEVMWQDGFSQKGVIVPPGINGVLKIDSLSNPKIARGIMMDPPSIHSNSVTVTFEWEPSHSFEDIMDFYYRIGTYDENGELIRRIVTKIISYSETSLVSHGADPFAQIINDQGLLNNITYANAQYYGQMSNAEEKNNAAKRAFYFGDFKDVENLESGIMTLHNTAKFNIDKNKTENQNKMTQEEIQKFLEGFIGEGKITLKEGENLTMELLNSKVSELCQHNSELSKKNKDLIEEVESLKKAKTEDKFSEIGKAHLNNFREETISSYKKLNGETIDEAIISLISSETTSLETLVALKKTYDQQLEDKFPMSCSKCGSKDISRSSSISNNDEEKVDSYEVQDSIQKLVNNKLKS